MAEPKPKCFGCDNICEALNNSDSECWSADQEALAQFIMAHAAPQQPYGQPQELPPIRIPEAMKHHVTRDGR